MFWVDSSRILSYRFIAIVLFYILPKTRRTSMHAMTKGWVNQYNAQGVEIYKRKQENTLSRKKERKRARNQKREKTFFFSWSLSWSRACFLSYFLVFFYKFSPLSLLFSWLFIINLLSEKFSLFFIVTYAD